MWSHLTSKLLFRKRIITIDLSGHGQTEYINYVHTMELMAEIVNAVLNNAKVSKVIFKGAQ